ncbi:MAG: hypothetical protein PWP72_1563 [Thermoanaerobacter sp.]|nr:hypothetical protein [Thermoanaerobacter sp.]
MIINTQTTLVMRCPECGKLERHEVSRFALAGARSSLHIHCSCGALKSSFVVRRKRVYIEVPCVVCGSSHTSLVTARALWSRTDNIELFCQVTGLELGYLGVQSRMRDQVYPGNTLDGMDFLADGFFHNQEVMSAVIRHLHNLGREGRIYCECGNQHIDVDVFPDRLELHCRRCQNYYIVYAETRQDLDAIERAWKIKLSRHTCGCFGSPPDKPHHNW